MFCHDAFYFLPDKPHVAAEMRRVSAGPVLVGHAHNALVDNLSAGSPLPPAEYAALFGAPLLYDDLELTRALVEARAPRAGAAGRAGAGGGGFAGAGRVAAAGDRAGWRCRRAGAALRRNPLYSGDMILWPSDRYQKEYGALATYPLEATGPERAVAGSGPEVDELARRRVLLDLPASW